MLFSLLLSAIGLSQLASAHFSIDYPYWRGDSFVTPGASQWLWPCANVSQDNSTNNRTLWPLKGGSIKLEMHHPWTLMYINVGYGNTWVGAVNTTLVSNFNETGNGTFCIKDLSMDGILDGVKDGDNGTIQVVTVGDTGSALYNCADVTFSSKAELLSDTDCFNSSNVGGVAIANVASGTPSPTGTATGAQASKTGAASALQPLGGLFVAGIAAALFV